MSARYVTTRPGKDGALRRFWQPPAALKCHGFVTQRLSDDATQAEAQAAPLNAALDEWRSSGQAPQLPKGSIAALIADYKASHLWRELTRSTRKSYTYALRVIRAEYGNDPVRGITAWELEKFYRRLRKTPAKMAQVSRVMRVLMEFAIKRNLITVNPAAKPGISYTAPKGMLWSREQVQAFITAADKLDLFDMGTAVCLNEWLGQRPSDIYTMRQDCYRNGAIIKTQKKTGAEVELPVDLVPHLQERIAAQLTRNAQMPHGSRYLLAGISGAGISESTFNSLFNLIRTAAGLPKNLNFRTLRHTAITRMGEAGVPLQHIAAVSGHSFKTCEQILDRYNIRTAKMAQEAFRLRLASEGQAA